MLHANYSARRLVKEKRRGGAVLHAGSEARACKKHTACRATLIMRNRQRVLQVETGTGRVRGKAGYRQAEAGIQGMWRTAA